MSAVRPITFFNLKTAALLFMQHFLNIPCDDFHLHVQNYIIYSKNTMVYIQKYAMTIVFFSVCEWLVPFAISR